MDVGIPGRDGGRSGAGFIRAPRGASRRPRPPTASVTAEALATDDGVDVGSRRLDVVAIASAARSGSPATSASCSSVCMRWARCSSPPRRRRSAGTFQRAPSSTARASRTLRAMRSSASDTRRRLGASPKPHPRRWKTTRGDRMHARDRQCPFVRRPPRARSLTRRRSESR